MVSGPSQRLLVWGRREAWASWLCQVGGVGLGRGPRGMPRGSLWAAHLWGGQAPRNSRSSSGELPG